MPIPQTIRVNPLDLQKNIAIGVSLPFNGPGVFKSTYTTKDQIKSNNNIETLKDNILSSILTYIYEITVTNIVLVPDTDNNLVSLTIEYYLNISQTPDQITVQFT